MVLGLYLSSFTAHSQNKDTSNVLLDSVEIEAFEFIEPNFLPSEVFEAFQTHQSDTTGLFDAMNLSERIAMETGLFVKSNGPSGISTATFRGFSSSHTQVYWNGLLLNSPSLGQADLSMLPAGLFSDIRIDPGSAGLAYGSGNLGGAIQLENSLDDKNHISFKQTYGSFQRMSTNLQTQFTVGKSIHQFRGVYSQNKNQYPYVDITEKGWPMKTRKNANWSSKGLSSSHHFNIAKTQWNIHLLGNMATRNLPSTLLEDANKKQKMKDEVLGIVVLGKFKKDWVVQLGSGYLQNTYFNNQLDSASKNTSNQQHFALRKSHRFGKFKIKAEYAFRQFMAQTAGYSFKKQRQNSVFTSLSYKPISKLRTLITLRGESNNSSFAPILGAIGAEYFPENWVGFSFSGSKNYRYPTLNQLYWNPGGNPNLAPENSYQIEAKLLLKPHILNFASELEILYYKAWVSNWIGWVPAGSYWEAQNTEFVQNQGIELRISVNKEWGNSALHLKGSYNYMQSSSRVETDISSKPLQRIYVPFHSGAMSMEYQYKNLGMVYQQNYRGSYFISTDNLVYMPAFSIANLTVYYTKKVGIKNNLRFFASASNLFNVDYQIVPYLPEYKRNFQIGLQYCYQ